MLVFKDAILGLTAGVTLASNGFIKIGDWIVVPGAGADGDVIDIALTTVRVQNFDKTITTIPAYDLVSKPFTNWRGMVDAGGRRIKRAIQIDLDSIAFATEADLKRWKKIDLLKEYLAQKESEITTENAARPTSKDSLANARNLTNIGTFRAYCIAYLRNHARIHQGLTLLVRQLPPAERGFPVEIYCFTNSTVWEEYEATQSDIFDHLLAILPEFGLSAFQVTSAAALRNATQSLIR
jgi:miniconductance mechanosensitive channel